MSKITLFYLTNCPYCKNAAKAITELYQENPAYQQIELDRIEESQRPEIAEKYDYYYVPTMFIGTEKKYEAHPGESFEECKGNIKKVFDGALE